VRRTRVKLLLALGSAIAVTAVVFGSANGSSTSVAAPAQGSIDSAIAPAQGSIDSAVASTPKAGKTGSSPAKMHGYATPHRIPPLRTLKAEPGDYSRGKQPEPEFETYLTRQPGSSTVDPVVQRTAPKGQIPPPIQNFEGVNNLCGCYPPDTEGDVGPNHYMQWVNLHYAIYSKTGQLLVGPLPGNTLFQGGQSPYCGSHNNGDPIVLYNQ